MADLRAEIGRLRDALARRDTQVATLREALTALREEYARPFGQTHESLSAAWKLADAALDATDEGADQ